LDLAVHLTAVSLG